LGGLYANNLNNVRQGYADMTQQILGYMQGYWKESDATMDYLMSF